MPHSQPVFSSGEWSCGSWAFFSSPSSLAYLHHQHDSAIIERDFYSQSNASASGLAQFFNLKGNSLMSPPVLWPVGISQHVPQSLFPHCPHWTTHMALHMPVFLLWKGEKARIEEKQRKKEARKERLKGSEASWHGGACSGLIFTGFTMSSQFLGFTM